MFGGEIGFDDEYILGVLSSFQRDKVFFSCGVSLGFYFVEYIV